MLLYTVGRKNIKAVFHYRDSLGAHESQRSNFQGLWMRLSKRERSGSDVLQFSSAPSGPGSQRCVHLFSSPKVWLFKDSAENLVPYLGIETETEHLENLFLIVCTDFFWTLSLWAQPCCLNRDKTPIGTIIRAVSGEKHYAFAGRSMKYFKMNKPFTCMCFMKSCL